MSLDNAVCAGLFSVAVFAVMFVVWHSSEIGRVWRRHKRDKYLEDLKNDVLLAIGFTPAKEGTFLALASDVQRLKDGATIKLQDRCTLCGR